MSSEWPSLTVGDLIRVGEATIQTGPFGSQLHSHDYVAIGTPVIPTEAIGRGLILDVDVPMVGPAKAAELSRHRLHRGDILFARRGAQATGLAAVVDERYEGALCGTGALLLRTQSPRVSPDYLAIFLSSDFAYKWLRAHAVGAVVPNLNTEIIRALPLVLPPVEAQRELAKFFGMLNDRITLLRETNATLEAIAQALFKSWFVDFDPVRAKSQAQAPAGMDEATAALFPDVFEESALGLVPKGWAVGTLGDVCTNPRMGAKPEHIPAQTPYFGLEHMPRRSIALANAGTAEGLESGKFWFERDDVLFGKLRPYFHKVGLAPTRGVCSTDILVLRPKILSLLGFVAMHMSSDALIAHTTMLSNGARMPRSSWQDIAGFGVVLPPNAIAAAFNEVAYPLFKRIYANIEVARILSEARDTLLPRLISGQLRLPEAEAIAEAVI